MKSYDKLPTNFGAVLDLPMTEGIGTITKDIGGRNAVDHTATLTGPPTWTQLALNNLTVLSFNPATPDFLEIPAAETTDLDFQVQEFTLLAWIYVDTFTVNRMIFCRGLLNTDGWFFSVNAGRGLSFTTNQAAASQTTASSNALITAATWTLVGVSRYGAAPAWRYPAQGALIYKNGVMNGTGHPATVHVNPLTSARKLLVGIYDDEASNPADGYIWRPRILERAISPSEHRNIFEAEKELVGLNNWL